MHSCININVYIYSYCSVSVVRVVFLSVSAFIYHESLLLFLEEDLYCEGCFGRKSPDTGEVDRVHRPVRQKTSN